MDLLKGNCQAAICRLDLNRRKNSSNETNDNTREKNNYKLTDRGGGGHRGGDKERGYYQDVHFFRRFHYCSMFPSSETVVVAACTCFGRVLGRSVVVHLCDAPPPPSNFFHRRRIWVVGEPFFIWRRRREGGEDERSPLSSPSFTGFFPSWLADSPPAEDEEEYLALFSLTGEEVNNVD